MAFETALQPASSPLSDHPQDIYPYCSYLSCLDTMNHSSSFNESSEVEGYRSPSSRSNTETIGLTSTYSTTNASDMDSLRYKNVSQYDYATGRNPSRSYSSPGGLNTSTSIAISAPGISMADYTDNSKLFEDFGSNMFWEAETLDPLPRLPSAFEIGPLPPWSHLSESSQNLTGGEINTYPADFDLLVPWRAENAGWSAREALNPPNHSEGTAIEKNKSDLRALFRQTPEQIKDDSGLRCPEVGCGKSFSRTADMKRHQREIHDPGQKRFFCGCCNTKPRWFKREEKLISHKVKFHGFAKASELKTCSECSRENSLGSFYFCSDESITRHKELTHGIRPVNNKPNNGSGSTSETFNEKSIQGLLDGNNLDDVPPVSTSKSTKRERQSDEEGTAKRAKMDGDVFKSSLQQGKTDSNESIGQESDNDTESFKLKEENRNLPAEEILVPDVGISDFYALSEHKVIRAIEEDLKLENAGGLVQPEISFNAFQGSIRIRGFGDVTIALQSIVNNLLGKRERLGSPLKDLTSLNLLCMRSKSTKMPQPQTSGVKIFPMRQIEDGELLKVWHEKIIPSLPGLLARTIEGNCSASLVRKGLSEFSGRAVIQIQTHILPSKAVRDYIRNKIVHWVNKDISLRGSQVEFLKGRLTTLAGELHSIHETGESPEQSDTASEDNDDPECYPYYKRYWRTPGPGASIGLLCTRSIAATICCYIHVEGRLFILTVKHFITKSNAHLLAGTTDRTTVVSPALADVDDMREKFTQIVTDFKNELDEAMKNHFGDKYSEYISRGDIGSLPDHVQDLMAKLDVVRKDLSHLTEGDRPFRLGSLAYQSASPSISDPPLFSYPGQNYGHHMDWAVCSVDPQRAGTNRHRYKYNKEEQAVDFYSGETDTFGAGQPFLETCVIEPNTKVHFVGQATGRQSGEINAARILVLHDGITSEEWAMITTANEQDGNDMIHKGDSGASVVRDCDNKLMGIIWARTQNGQLVLTPIGVVFDDIRQKVPASDVSLPPLEQDQPPNIPLNVAVHEVDTICRDKTMERPKSRRRFRSSDMPSPKRKVLPHSNQEIVARPRSELPVTKSVSLPIVMPSSQLPPIFVPPNTISRTVIALPDYFPLAQQVFRTLEIKKTKHSIGFLLSGYSHQEVERRQTFPQTHDKLLNRAGTWPGKYCLRFDSQNTEASNAISVS